MIKNIIRIIVIILLIFSIDCIYNQFSLLNSKFDTYHKLVNDVILISYKIDSMTRQQDQLISMTNDIINKHSKEIEDLKERLDSLKSSFDTNFKFKK